MIVEKTIHNIKYKTGPHKLALKLVNNDWVTSTRLNKELEHIVVRSEARLVKQRQPGKSSTFTYLEAQELHRLVKNRVETIGSAARKACVDRGTVERAIELYEDVGTDGFVLYGEV